jgi:hypothetical protein
MTEAVTELYVPAEHAWPNIDQLQGLADAARSALEALDESPGEARERLERALKAVSDIILSDAEDTEGE